MVDEFKMSDLSLQRKTPKKRLRSGSGIDYSEQIEEGKRQIARLRSFYTTVLSPPKKTEKKKEEKKEEEEKEGEGTLEGADGGATIDREQEEGETIQKNSEPGGAAAAPAAAPAGEDVRRTAFQVFAVFSDILATFRRLIGTAAFSIEPICLDTS